MVFAFFWSFAPCSLCLALLLPPLLGSSLSAEVPSLALLTKFRLAETAPQAIWHLPLLTVTAGLSPQSIEELHLPRKCMDSCHSPIPSETRLARRHPRFFLLKIPTKHPSAQNRKLCLSRVLLHDDLTSEDIDENMHLLHSGIVSRPSLTSDDSSSHPLSHAALSHVPFPPLPQSSPSSPRPLSCVLTNQPEPDTKRVTPINTLWTNLSGNRRCCRWGHVGAEQAMQRTCFIRRTAHNAARHNSSL